MVDPFTLRIFVPNGDPESVRIIDRMNWTGAAIVFPRDEWSNTKKLVEFGLDRPGIYFLVGYDQDEDIPKLYIGQTDDLLVRIGQHFRKTAFWERAILFTSTNNSLNRAHVSWLEHALIQRAKDAGRSLLENGQGASEPNLTASEKADTKIFLNEVLQILPLVGLRALETPKAVSSANASEATKTRRSGVKTDKDTIIVPAQKEGFERVFLGEDAWYAIRISGGMLPRIKWIAAYQTQPVSAITHLAEVDHIEPYGEDGKYKVVFKGTAEKLPKKIVFAGAKSGAMQGPRYTTLARLKTAKHIADLTK